MTIPKDKFILIICVTSINLCSLQSLSLSFDQQQLLDTGMLKAAEATDIDQVALFLAKGANIDARDAQGKTALHKAAEFNEELVKFLVNYGADVTVKDDLGRIPLHVAARNGTLLAIKMLIDAGSPVNALSNSGKTPLDVAKDRHNQAIEQILIEHGGQPGAQQSFWRSFLSALMVDPVALSKAMYNDPLLRAAWLQKL